MLPRCRPVTLCGSSIIATRIIDAAFPLPASRFSAVECCAMAGDIHVLSHPLAVSFLTGIRDVNASRALIRHHVRELASLLFHEATRDLPLQPVRVTTPLTETDGAQVGATVGLVPILRSGLGMVDGILEMLPD